MKKGKSKHLALISCLGYISHIDAPRDTFDSYIQVNPGTRIVRSSGKNWRDIQTNKLARVTIPWNN